MAAAWSFRGGPRLRDGGAGRMPRAPRRDVKLAHRIERRGRSRRRSTALAGPSLVQHDTDDLAIGLQNALAAQPASTLSATMPSVALTRTWLRASKAALT